MSESGVDQVESVEDDRVVVEWPFSRLDLGQPPQMFVPEAVRVKTPRIPRTGKARAARLAEEAVESLVVRGTDADTLGSGERA